jgi:hypothetical protein
MGDVLKEMMGMNNLQLFVGVLSSKLATLSKHDQFCSMVCVYVYMCSTALCTKVYLALAFFFG